MSHEFFPRRYQISTKKPEHKYRVKVRLLTKKVPRVTKLYEGARKNEVFDVPMSLELTAIYVITQSDTRRERHMREFELLRVH